MNKIDCSKVLNFISEWERRRKIENRGSLGYCELNDVQMSSINEAIIKELQKWSDEHPRMTRKDKLLKLLKENGFKAIADNIDKSDCGGVICIGEKCDECKKWWDEEVDDKVN